MRISWLWPSVVLGLTVFSSPVFAAAPPLIPVQGILTDSDGKVADGKGSFTFRLFETEKGGKAKYTETFAALQVDEGAFTAYLGEHTPLDLSLFDESGELYLEIQIGEDDVLSPRIRLGTVPYAAYAEYCEDAKTLDGAPVGDFASASHQHKWSDIEGRPEETCPAGQAAIGLDATGDVLCGDFVASDQSCPPGEFATGLDASGALLCDVDTDPTYDGADFATSNQACTVGSLVTGIASDGSLVCTSGSTALTGDLQVSGNLTVSGSSTFGGETLGYPQSPQIFFDFRAPGCVAGAALGTVLPFPKPFAAAPVLITTIDETFDDNGPWVANVVSIVRSRAALLCQTQIASDGLHWLAMDEGRHTLDGKAVEAGRTTSAIFGTSVVFSTPFPSTPIVLVTNQMTPSGLVSPTFSGPLYVATKNVTASGFTIIHDGGTAAAVHWIALEQGEYTVGRYHFFADRYDGSGSGINNATCGGTSTSCLVPFTGGMFVAEPNVLLSVEDNAVVAVASRMGRLQSVGVSSFHARLNTQPMTAIDYVLWEDL